MTNDGTGHQPERSFRVPLVIPFETDRLPLRVIFHGSNWRLEQVGHCRQALHMPRGGHVPVIICERDLPDGDWKGLLDNISSLPKPPHRIVSSRGAEKRPYPAWRSRQRGAGPPRQTKTPGPYGCSTTCTHRGAGFSLPRRFVLTTCASAL